MRRARPQFVHLSEADVRKAIAEDVGGAVEAEVSRLAAELTVRLMARAGEGSGERVWCGMVCGMATAKITITLEKDQIEEIRSLVAAGKTANISAFVKHAVGVGLHDAAGWREMLKDALDQTGGPLTKKERAWADAVLSPRRQKRSSRKGYAA